MLEIWYNTNRHRDGRHLAENRTFSYQQIHAHKPLFGNQGKLLNLGHLDFDIVSNFELRISYFSYRDTLHDSRDTPYAFGNCFFLKIQAVSQIAPIVTTEPTTPAKLVQPADISAWASPVSPIAELLRE